jgi:uncharacterized protein (TIGR02145 family)
MKKSNLFQRIAIVPTLLIALLFLPLLLNAQEKGIFTDNRDGRSYHWIKMGSQVWMTENLVFKAVPGSWVYNNDSVNEVNFGRLYSWKAAQTACPKGWHLPSEKEWNAFLQALGGSSVAGLKIQEMDTIGDIVKGIAPLSYTPRLLCGVRHPDGTCSGINYWGGCWTSGKVNDTVATNVLFVRNTKEVGFSTNDKNSGFLVRCVRNK